jgi:hypothetical protein
LEREYQASSFLQFRRQRFVIIETGAVLRSAIVLGLLVAIVGALAVTRLGLVG